MRNSYVPRKTCHTGIRRRFDPTGKHERWTAAVPEELKAKATAVIGNIAPEECAQCPKLEWLQTWSAGVDKYQHPGILQPGSMLTNATGAYGQSVSEHMFAMMWSIMKNLHIYAVGNPNAAW